ncbi:hypothetical protein PG993_005209 [Apiospora rasikravindrae]|uniref:CENP-V/GFA domain-containing protein n=1 Tax=Apiospora rasikravindrae TaxID=990691 RepID=A0ABR1TGY0_9PEZI
MSESAKPRTGSCQCGAVQVQIQGTPLEMHLCHCSTCQKVSGSVFAALVTLKEEQLTITVKPGLDAESTLKVYKGAPGDNSGSVSERTFCSTCGSQILLRNNYMPGISMVPLGILEPYPLSEDGSAGIEGREGGDGEGWAMKPMIEYWCVRKRQWVGETGAELVFKTGPETVEDLAELKKIFGLA